MPGAEEPVGGAEIVGPASGAATRFGRRILGVVLSVALGVSQLAAPSQAAELAIVATTSDMASLAAAVGGDLVAVTTLVPPGSDPEAFEPRPRDLLRLRSADLVVRVGLGFDFWLDKLLAEIDRPELLRGGSGSVDASLGIPLLERRGAA